MKTRSGYYSEAIRNEAFESILDSLNERQRDVLNVIRKWQPISSERIAEHLNIYPHQVTPRVLELREMELIEFAGKSTSDKSKRPVSLWRTKQNASQFSLFS